MLGSACFIGFIILLKSCVIRVHGVRGVFYYVRCQKFYVCVDKTYRIFLPFYCLQGFYDYFIVTTIKYILVQSFSLYIHPVSATHVVVKGLLSYVER